MNSGEYIAVVLVLCGIVIFVLADKLIAALLGSKRLTAEEIQSLKKLVEKLK